MVLKIRCDFCGGELFDEGALIISPPNKKPPHQWLVSKYHCCIKCWDAVALVLGSLGPKTEEAE